MIFVNCVFLLDERKGKKWIISYLCHVLESIHEQKCGIQIRFSWYQSFLPTDCTVNITYLFHFHVVKNEIQIITCYAMLYYTMITMLTINAMSYHKFHIVCRLLPQFNCDRGFWSAQIVDILCAIQTQMNQDIYVPKYDQSHMQWKLSRNPLVSTHKSQY